MSGTDPRPRPRYGEYATPQDQAKAIAVSHPSPSPLLVPGGDRPTATGRDLPPSGTGAAPRTASRVRRRPWDVALTVTLLVWGLFLVVGGMLGAGDLSSAIQQAYDAQAIGTFRPTQLAASIGVAMNTANLVIYAATLLVSVRLLVARRLAFYVPLVGGAVALLATTVLLTVVLANDPAFQEFVASMG